METKFPGKDTTTPAAVPAAAAAPASDVAEGETSSNHTGEDMRRYISESFVPQPPGKIIDGDHSLVEVFRRSSSFFKILTYLEACAEAVARTPNNGRTTYRLADAHPVVQFFLQNLFPFMTHLVETIPLEDMAAQRFGNRAKRTWHQQMEAGLVPRLRELAGLLVDSDPAAVLAAGGDRTKAVNELADEIAEYVKDSFGNSVRLDYGTGHELHFFMVIVICLQCLGDHGGALTLPASASEAATAPSADMLPEGSLPSHYLHERVRHVPPPADITVPGPVPPADLATCCDLRQQFVFFVFEQGYLRFMRLLQKHYCLEPAGSHGVWGLDDYHHIPYIFGAAQLIGREQAHTLHLHREPQTDVAGDTIEEAREEAILPKHISEPSKVKLHKGRYMYFDMIDWILTNKIGPFHEHSNMLYNISGVAYWEKIYGGMMKMYAAEVLAKFNVTQHLLFGRHLPWNTKKVE